MPFVLLLFGATFSAATCCMNNPFNGGQSCVDTGSFGNTPGGGGGGGGPPGGGGGATPTPVSPAPTPTPLPLDPPIQRMATGLYSYGDTTTNCTDILDNVVDPISIVVHLDQNAAFALGLPLTASEHIAHHGWSDTSGNGQYFQSGHGVINSCAENDVSLADGDDFSSRNHTRGSTQPDVIDWGYGGPWIMTPLTPHYDKLVSCGHAVPESVNPPGTPEYSGFSAARDTLISHWILDADAQHRFVIEASFWSNRQRMSQCNGDLPRSDGWVYFLGVCEVHSAVITPC